MSKNFDQGQQGHKPMSTVLASEYVRKMVERETTGNGDMENAVRRIAKAHKLSFWQLMHIRAGRAKMMTVESFFDIRRAYLDFCAAEIRKLETELSRARDEHGDDPFEDIGDEIETLAAKIKAAKERIM